MQMDANDAEMQDGAANKWMSATVRKCPVSLRRKLIQDAQGTREGCQMKFDDIQHLLSLL